MLYTAFLLGLLGSLHCLGMCGPIAFMLPIGTAKGLKKVGYVGLYHLGRLMAYALIGSIFGVLGKSLTLFGVQQQLSIGIGVLMLLSVAIPFVFHKYKNSPCFVVNTYHKWVFKIQSKLGKTLKKSNPDTLLTIGFLNGFLPCGLVSMALLGAIGSSGGHPLTGGLYMVYFGLGTVPMMSAAVYMGQKIKGFQRKKLKKLVPVFVGIIGILFILRGLGLGIPYVSPSSHIVAGQQSIECHIPQ